jgi:Glyoxalase-like domain
MIGRLEKTVIDCPEPRALASFYCQVLGMSINGDLGDWVVICSAPGQRPLAFRRAADWVPARWPDPAHPRQMHLDIRVSDADRAEQPSGRSSGDRPVTAPYGGTRS